MENTIYEFVKADDNKRLEIRTCVGASCGLKSEEFKKLCELENYISNRKVRYYLGLDNEKDLLLIDFIEYMNNSEDFNIIKLPDKMLIIEQVGTLGDRKDTGKVHIGYDYHYVSFKYKNRNIIYYVELPYFWAFDGLMIMARDEKGTQLGYPSYIKVEENIIDKIINHLEDDRLNWRKYE